MKTDISVTYHEPFGGESMELTADIEVTPEGEVEMTNARCEGVPTDLDEHIEMLWEDWRMYG